MLEIQEPELKRRHQQVLDALISNNLNPEWEYSFEPDPNFNSSIHYSIEVKGQLRLGFFCVNKGQFAGAICKTEQVKYLQAEGFSEEQIEEEPIFAAATCPLSFVLLLALPVVNDLQFSEELWDEFDRNTKLNKKGKGKKRGK